MSVKLTRPLIGLVMIAAFAAVGCSSHSHPANTHRTTPHSQNATSSGGAGGIPQNNGGDHDADNSGGPSDGDGNL